MAACLPGLGAKAVKVHLPGHGNFWCLSGDSMPGHALAVPAECDDAGELLVPESFLKNGAVTLSYAHVFEDGTIMRFGEVIGHAGQLQEGWQTP